MTNPHTTRRYSVEASAPQRAASGVGGERAASQVPCLETSLEKWLSATAQAQAIIARARTGVERDIAALQLSIMLAQDNLSPDNKVGQRALAKKIDCAEHLNRTAHRFARLGADMGCLAAIAGKLADVLTALGAHSPDAFYRVPAPAGAGRPALAEGPSMAGQLAAIRLRVEQLAERINDKPVAEVWDCVLSLRPVVAVLSQQTVDVMVQMRGLSAVIGSLDREILNSRAA